MKHVAIKHFLSTDRIKNGNIEVLYFPTDEMLADYNLKVFLGKAFTTFRRGIMGWGHIGTICNGYTHPKERVENKEEVVSKDSLSNHAKIVERKRELTRKQTQNRECMDETKQHLTLAPSH